MKTEHLLVTDTDRCRLGQLLTGRNDRAWGVRRRRAELYSLLEEATPIKPADAPESLVTMNSIVELEELESGIRHIVTLVYPQDSGVTPNSISILKPLGTALIGCEEGNLIQLSDEGGVFQMRVVRVMHQPERAGLKH